MSQVMVKPKTTEEVSKIMKYCNYRRLVYLNLSGLFIFPSSKFQAFWFEQQLFLTFFAAFFCYEIKIFQRFANNSLVDNFEKRRLFYDPNMVSCFYYLTVDLLTVSIDRIVKAFIESPAQLKNPLNLALSVCPYLFVHPSVSICMSLMPYSQDWFITFFWFFAWR